VSEIKDLKKIIKEKSKQWKSIHKDKGNEDAKKYYDKELFPNVIDFFIEKHGKLNNNKYKVLILTLGFSPEPLSFSITLFKPEKIILLTTNQSRNGVDTIFKHTNRGIKDTIIKTVSNDNPNDVYKKIKEGLSELPYGFDQVAVDFTGGTKAMTGGAIMAASILNMDIYYIASESNRKLKRSEPGTERLVRITSPYQYFGDIKADKAINSWNNFDYISALKIFKELENEVPNPRKFEVLSSIACAYTNWGNFNFSTSYKYMKQAVDSIDRFNIIDKELPKLKEQLGLLEKVRNKDNMDEYSIVQDIDIISYIIFSVYCSCIRMAEKEKYDLASLLIYRVLESIEQRRLASNDINVFDTTNLSSEKNEKLFKKINCYTERQKELNAYLEVPEKISVFDGYIILAALNDILAQNINWRDFKSNLDARNKCIYTHGYHCTKKKSFYKLKKIVDEKLKKLCEIEGIDYSEMKEKCTFISLENEDII